MVISLCTNRRCVAMGSTQCAAQSHPRTHQRAEAWLAGIQTVYKLILDTKVHRKQGYIFIISISVYRTFTT